MRLLHCLLGDDGSINIAVKEFLVDLPPYSILSHRWGKNEDEVTYQELLNGSGHTKRGYDKIEKCCRQTIEDGFAYTWIDTCVGRSISAYHSSSN
jgi:hypothetical protein